MNALLATDLFATKGLEYLLVLGFLAALILYWRLIARPRPTPRPALASAGHLRSPSGWFQLARERWYHPGHGWAQPDDAGLVTVGVDDFAQKLIGRANAIGLPPPGASVRQGESLSSFTVGDRAVEVLSPVDGEVVEVNLAALASPQLVNDDPYGRGWLVKVQPERLRANLRGLLRGKLARAWTASMEDTLRGRMSESLGLFLQDGGVPVAGIARSIDPERWDEVAREFLLS